MSEEKGKYEVPGTILAARNELGLTRRAMARALGLSLRAIQCYEKGDYAPSKRTMRDVNKLLEMAKEQKMAKEIGIPFRTIFEAKPTVQPPIPIPSGKPMSTVQPPLTIPSGKPMSTVQPPIPFPSEKPKEPTNAELMSRIAKLESMTPALATKEPTHAELMSRIAKLERLILAWFSCDSKESQTARQ